MDAPHAVAEAIPVLHRSAFRPGPELQAERLLIGIGKRKDTELVVVVEDAVGVAVVRCVDVGRRDRLGG
jgi:hypothetical protein